MLQIKNLRPRRGLPARKLAIALAFLFIITPFTPVLAETADSPASVPTAADTTIAIPTSDATPAAPDSGAVSTPPDATTPAASVDDATDQKPVDETPPQSSAQSQQDLISGVPQQTATKQIIPEPDQTTGALVSSYPLVIPPGRNGMQPDLKLLYNSQNTDQDGPVGYGWSVSIPYIQRINKTGVNKLYTDNYFTSSLSGELALVSGTTYASKTENGDFLKYVFDGTTWTVTDKSGTVYKFGAQAATRQDNPSDSTQVFKWMLEEVRDTNSNYVSYTYYKDAGQIYPDTIVYTGNGVTAGIFEADFLRQSRADNIKSYQTGFLATTSYRFNEIDVKTSGTITRRYTLGYTTGDNGNRSSLSAITEAGTDEITLSTITLPATGFTGTHSTTPGWSFNGSWTLPSDTSFDGRSLLADVNGDSLPDIMTSYDAANNVTVRETYLNNGGGTWTLSTAYEPPVSFKTAAGASFNYFAQDLNGDGLADLFNSNVQCNGQISCNTVSNVYLNNGNGWTLASYVLPTGLYYGANPLATVADFNGDGLPDIYISNFNINGIYPLGGVYLNNGDGTWTTATPNWTFPYDSNQTKASYVDLNGDGICDIIYFDYNPSGQVTTANAYLGTGNGQFVSSSAYTPSLSLSFFGAGMPSDYGIRYADVNGDRLIDLVQSTYWNGQAYKITYLNSGNGWGTNNTSWNAPASAWFSVNGNAAPIGLVDLNGDGLPDAFDNSFSLYLNTGTATDLLATTTLPTGGSTSVTYVSSGLWGYNGLNPKLPLIMQTVSQINVNDGFGTTGTFSYVYAAGSYYFDPAAIPNRKFAGFATITKTDPAINTTKTYFHQGNTSDSTHGEYSDEYWKIGKPYRVETANSSGSLYSKTINKWDSYDLGNARKFVKLAQSVNSTYDGDSTHRDTAESYTSENTYGNQSQKVQWGEVTGSDDGTFTDTGTDKFTTDYTYAVNTGSYIVGLPSQSTTTDQSAVKVKESKFYYDLQAQGTVTKGNLTKQEDWKTGSTYINSQKTYDSTYGLVTVDTDPRGKTTQYGYDTNNLYPATATNALTQATGYTYDYSSGKVKQTTDPNTRVFQNVYDGLDRLVEQKQPDIATPATLVTKTTYTYTDTSGAVSIKSSDYLDGTTIADSYTFFDGLARKIQERKEAEGTNFAVRDFVYNTRGLLDKESLPYFSTGSSKTSPTTDTNLLTTYSYDPVQRITTTVNAVGTTTNSYSDWKLTVTDPNSKTKDLYKDAYGNLIQVDEHNSPSTYTTTYLYNYLGNLTKITDALTNIRNFTYDGLGRRLTAQDLHASGDATFGTWTYTYDDAGNLSQSIDPKSQTINYSYDNINRQLTEDYTGQSGTEVTYTYDSGTDGIGRLTNVTNSAVTKALVYNALGLTKQETATLNAVNYVTTYDYDRQGNQTLITNQDNSQVKYIYNSAGLLDQVQRKESTDGGFINVVSNFDYGPHGKVTTQTNANGTTTTNTYDATKLYRLSRKQTSGPGGGGSPTTVTFYPAAGDGSVYYNNSNSWSTTHDATSGSAASYTGTTLNVNSGKYNSTKYKIERPFLPFDTSSLPDNAVVSTAKLKVYVDSKLNDDNDGDDWVTVAQGSEASPTSLVTADYDNAGSVSNPTEGIDNTERKDITGVSTGQYLVFTFNTTGKGWVSKTGNTKLALREGHDDINSSFTGSSGQYDQLTIRTAEYTGTTSDPILEVTYTTSPPAPTVIQDASYTYDNNGNVLTISDASGTDTAKITTYVYDDLNRLTSATVTGAANGDNTTKTYSYDAIGNISSSTDKGTYSYAGTNYANPHAATSIGGVTYTYDNNGNVTSDSIWTNTWDYNNQTSQSQKTGLTVTYAYDPAGTRVKLANGTTTTYYPTKFYNTDGTTPQKHIFAGGVLIATVKGTGAGATVSTDHTDQLTGTGPVTDSSGGMVQLLDYHPYGTFRVDWHYSSAVDEQRKFTGQEYDRDTGLNYMQARYYSPAIGKFISEDPSFLEVSYDLTDPQTSNSYSYASNNPLRYKDPDGRAGWDTVGNFFSGFNNAYYTNYAFGAGRNQGTGAYSVGQSFGDGVSFAQGLLEIAGGTITGTGGVAVSATGVGAIAGVPATAAGVALVGHGSSLVASSAYSFSKSLGGKKDTDVYIGSKNGEDRYVGISNNVPRRTAEHGPRFDEVKTITKGPLTRNQAKGLEQVIKEANPQFENRINSISPKNPIYQRAKDFGNSLLKAIGLKN